MDLIEDLQFMMRNPSCQPIVKQVYNQAYKNLITIVGNLGYGSIYISILIQ